ncbi:agamous-like MADS-box protein AGL62 [Chenopodium quinoa]|uniref:agamous-like MADS-box protein AGL62 n=1 Tax=Chenopodium quinoa TaxID=63459 RepID=UPI000B791780|nr:agamous-like MADS-box protein AGL62 [Chenopodium quinoa]
MVEENQVRSKPQGKRKIAIAKIENKARKQVAFSKRRKGVFKKASELCTLCNAEIAVLTFSEAGKVFTFGHPSADEVINRYINSSTSSPLSLSLDSSSVTNEHVGKEKLSHAATCSDEKDLSWWQKPVEGLGLEELEKFMNSLIELRINVASKIGNCWSNNNNVGSSANTPKSGLDLNEAYNPKTNGADE